MAFLVHGCVVVLVPDLGHCPNEFRTVPDLGNI